MKKLILAAAALTFATAADFAPPIDHGPPNVVKQHMQFVDFDTQALRTGYLDRSNIIVPAAARTDTVRNLDKTALDGKLDMAAKNQGIVDPDSTAAQLAIAAQIDYKSVIKGMSPRALAKTYVVIEGVGAIATVVDMSQSPFMEASIGHPKIGSFQTGAVAAPIDQTIIDVDEGRKLS